jgi:hypothetical protein
MNKFIGWVLPAIILFTGMAWANVYRCVSDDGTVRFSDQPCAGDAELFIEEEACDIDDSIRRANPLPDLSFNTAGVNDRLAAHARKLGKCILPDEPYVSYNIDERRLPGRYPSWEINVNFGDKDGRAKWKVTFKYDVRSKNRIDRIWMHTIDVRLTGYRHDPPSLKSVASLTRLSRGEYQVPWWVNHGQQ